MNNIYIMKLLKLFKFSGTGSVGKVARDKGYSVVSLDLKDADINFDILEWNYTEASRNNWHKKD